MKLAIPGLGVDPDELLELSDRYGQPKVRQMTLDADEYLFRSRRFRSRSRRGEVVMIIERTAGNILLHRKGWYEPGVYRLPTGGIEAGESIEDALARELTEETGLRGGDTRFLGVLTCRLRSQAEGFQFTSFLFHILRPRGRLDIPDSGEDISDIREVAISELPKIAGNLRRTPLPRQGWGNWRAVAHDFAYELLQAEGSE